MENIILKRRKEYIGNTCKSYKAKDVRGEIGQLLKLYRIKNGIKQKDLAKSMGISRSKLSGIERGEYDISIKDIMTMCKHNMMDASLVINGEEIELFNAYEWEEGVEHGYPMGDIILKLRTSALGKKVPKDKMLKAFMWYQLELESQKEEDGYDVPDPSTYLRTNGIIVE